MDGQEAEEFVDEGVIRCICGTIEDDGFTIQCEKCFVWQHAICVDITQESVPDIYFCENCNPRQLDYEVRAVACAMAGWHRDPLSNLLPSSV